MILDESSKEKILKAKNMFEEGFFNPKWSKIRPKEAPKLLARAMTENVTNIVGFGIGEKLTNGKHTGQISIRVYVIQKVKESEVPKNLLVPKQLNQVPTDVISVGRPVLRQNTFYIRPARGGVSIGNSNESSAGTLGCLVSRENQIFILSNNHVLARENQASQGEQIVQPGKIDGGTAVIATLCDFINVVADGQKANLVDAAIAQPLDPSFVSNEIIGIGRPKGTIEAARYRWVLKSGRTTDLTIGYIDDVDVTIQIPFENGIAKFTEQILIRGVIAKEYQALPTARYAPPFSDSGDSGSAIIDQRTKHVVGLLFAGSDSFNVTFANKIMNIESKLNVKIPWM